MLIKFKKEKIIQWTFFLLLLSLNFPPITVAHQFVAISTSFGNFSFPAIFSLILLCELIVSLLLNINKIKLNTSDLIFVVLIILIALGMGIHGVLFLSEIVSAFYVGRYLISHNLKETIIKTIKITVVVQIILNLYSTYISPFHFSPISGRTLFVNLGTGVGGGARAYGTLGQPIILGMFLGIGAMLWLSDIFDKNKSKVEKSWAILFLVPCLYFIYITYSRGTWSALILTIAYMLIKTGVIKKVKTWIMGILIVIIFINSSVFSSIALRFSILNSSSGSVSHRYYMVGWVFSYFREIPRILFGFGVGNIGKLLLSNPPLDGLLAIDNSYLYILLELGIVGSALVLLLLFNGIYKSHKNVNIQVFHFLLVYMLINMYSFDLWDWEVVLFPFWIVLGICTFTDKESNVIG